MAEEAEAAAADSTEAETNQANKRASPARSDIAFPYTHLEDAVAVARAISDSGTNLSRDQIAGVLGQPATSGGFSLRLGAARTFKLIEIVDGKNKLTDLGYRILSSDENEAKSARRESFLAVPLYQKTFETYRGRNLPPRPNGLEGAFVTFGVAPKQKDKARLAFERSAQFAGFFHAGREKLVEPILAPSQNGNSAPEVKTTPVAAAPVAVSAPDPAQQPLIRGLLDRIPQSDQPWSLENRARWLRTLAVNLAMIYGHDDHGDIEIVAPTPASRIAKVLAAAGAADSPSSPPAPQFHQAPSKPIPAAAIAAAAGGPSWEPAGGDLDDEIPF